MHAVMRAYSGTDANKLFDLPEKKKAEVKNVIMPIKGFVSYTLVRTARGGFSITYAQRPSAVQAERPSRTNIDRPEPKTAQKVA